MRDQHPREHGVPFDSDRAWMATTHTAGDGQFVVVKGAPDVLLPVIAGSPEASAARAWVTERATEGSRVLVVLEGCGSPIGDELPADLLVGLVALTDPPRDDLVPVLTTLADAGIRVTMMTGDHPATAQAVGRRVGLLPADSTTRSDWRDLVGEITPELVSTGVRPGPPRAEAGPGPCLARSGRGGGGNG